MSTQQVFSSAVIPQCSGSLYVSVAMTRGEIESSLRLRHEVFIKEMGARLPCRADSIETDEFDEYCSHLLVRDSETGKTIGSTRLLLQDSVRLSGMYYSETEFDIEHILHLPGRFMEVGRTCIHPDYRTGAAIRLLWTGIAQQMRAHDIDYLIGCVSLPMGDEGAYAAAIVEHLRHHYFTPSHLRVSPRLPLPCDNLRLEMPVTVPALLKGYLRAGANIAGDACWDPVFDVADLFVLLHRDRVAPRYARRFLECA